MADLTYVATQEGWLYLAGIKDVYTCEIVGYAMGERMTKELTGKALFMALRSQRPPAGLIHHSDRGSQYCAYDYRVIQEQSGLKTSMSRKGNCYDNAPMESFWGTLKNESLSHYRFNNRSWIHQIPDTSLQWEIVVAIVRLTRIFQRLLCKIRCCFF
ncbi:IS600 ORF2 [Shigella sonnei]|nr:IS600 ORF2 [Shigella sonnei]